MIKNWFLAFRPKTLTASLVPIMVASGLVYFEGHFYDPWVSVLALCGAVCIQITTNLVNDYIDFKKGADTSERLGPQRMTQQNKISEKSMIKGAIIFSLLALCFGIPLVLKGGWVLFIIGVLSLLMAYCYTGGPYPLAYLGLGDLFVILFFGLVAVGGVYYLHIGSYSWSALVAGLQVGFLSTVLIAINNFRDMHQDKKVNKKTLAVRFGAQFSRREIFSLYFLSLFLGIYWVGQGNYFAAFYPLICIPVMKDIVVGVYSNNPGRIFNKFLAQSALIQVIFSALITLGFVFG
jgi:1,4-dihydroxy-2-naphthoate octaprenyltransferase